MGKSNDVIFASISRLPKDLTEKMPSATNSPIFGRRSVAASTVAGGSGDIVPKTSRGDTMNVDIVTKPSRRAPMSVASMVRRFERDSSVDLHRLRGGGVKGSDPEISASSSQSLNISDEQANANADADADADEMKNVADDDDSDVKSVASDVKAKAVTPSRRSATASTPGPSTQKFSSRVSTTSFLASVAKSEQAPPRKSTPVRFVLSLGFL